MRIHHVELTGYRNFASTVVNLAEKTLVIGANDVGKTNFLHAIRLLLDRSLSEEDIEPSESDFHIKLDGSQSNEIKIVLKLVDITEDAVISRLKGHISADKETFLVYTAERAKPGYKLFIGHKADALEEIDSRYYLKHIHFKYVESCRDITSYIQKEKKYLLKTAKAKRSPQEETADAANETKLQTTLDKVNDEVNKLSYVAGATSGINDELKDLSHHNADYNVCLETQTMNFSSFVDRLRLGANSGGRRVGLGGDGRNNQILVGLWMAKAALEHDLDNEAVIYCIEEPEAHLHPHQQRKLADYLVNSIDGQVLVSTHSPQIASKFNPAGMVRFYEKDGNTLAAGKGCSKDLESAWKDFGYRMSVLPAEAFFADVALLVEGPSEVLLYTAMAEALSIDLDQFNVSILSIDGIDFEVYTAILSKLEIPFVLRTDNDVFKVPKTNPAKWRFAGLNRALKLLGEKEYSHSTTIESPVKLGKEWAATSRIANAKGVFLSKVDLENDLAQVFAKELKAFSGEDDIMDAVSFLQERKAIRMGEFLDANPGILATLKKDELAAPLLFAASLAVKRRKEPADKKEKVMKELNPTPEQLPAIEYEKNLVAIAKPGSGKTFVLSRKIQRILPALPSYRGVIAISFTNKASDELRHRSVGNGIDLKSSFFGTIDKFCIGEVIIPFLCHLWGRPAVEVDILRVRDLPENERNAFDVVENGVLTLEILESMADKIKSHFLKGQLLLDTAGPLALYTIKNSLACQHYLKIRYSHVIIDEYQDSGLAQHELFMKLVGLGMTGVAVGDADQSIYGFSNKDSKYLLSLAANRDFKTFPITLNHRCHPSIINYSLRFLDPKASLLKSDKIFVWYKSCNGTATAIAKWIDSVLSKVKADFGVVLNKHIGILVRSNQTGLLVNNALTTTHRLAHPHPLEENTSLWGVIFSDLVKYRFDNQQTAQEIIDRHNFQLAYAQIAEARKRIMAIRNCPEEKLYDLMESIAKIFRPNAAKDGPIALLRACTYEDLKKSFTPAEDNEVQIMTIHKSKGLEFDVVFHLDLYEWVLPGKTPGDNDDFDDPIFSDWEQDKNLHYVGITRARKLCVLCTSTKRINSNNNERQGKPSEFLSMNGLEKLRMNFPF